MKVGAGPGKLADVLVNSLHAARRLKNLEMTKDDFRALVSFILRLIRNLVMGQALLTGAKVDGPAPDPEPITERIIPRIKLYLDPGHHAGITSNRSPQLPDGSYFYEWESNLRWALDIEKAAMAIGFDTVITLPDAADQQESREDILQFRRRLTSILYDKTPLIKVFISLHSNADGQTGIDEWGTAHGLEIFVDPQAKEGPRHAARIMTDALLRALMPNTRDRSFKTGYKATRKLYLLKQLNITGVLAMLIEFEFHDSPIGVAQLTNPEWRARAVQGVIEGCKALNKWV